MQKMWPIFFLVSLVILIAYTNIFASDTISFNPRDDYQFGVGTAVGGPYGVVGITSGLNWYSTFNFELGAGSGIYFDTYNVHARYLAMDNALSPYVGGGFAYWDSVSDAKKMAEQSTQAVDLGLVNSDGSSQKNGILILPLSVGLSYISELGLSLYLDFEFMVSTANFKGIPYGTLGFQWYF